MFVIFSQRLPELSGAAADEMFDGLQSLQDAIRRRSLEPLVKVVHQMATVIRALVAKLDQNLPTFIYDGLQSEASQLTWKTYPGVASSLLEVAFFRTG